VNGQVASRAIDGNFSSGEEPLYPRAYFIASLLDFYLYPLALIERTGFHNYWLLRLGFKLEDEPGLSLSGLLIGRLLLWSFLENATKCC